MSKKKKLFLTACKMLFLFAHSQKTQAANCVNCFSYGRPENFQTCPRPRNVYRYRRINEDEQSLTIFKIPYSLTYLFIVQVQSLLLRFYPTIP